jgi:hypothetical protein
MEPNDPQLRDLLREWQTPAISPAVEERVLKLHRGWSNFLLHGSIRVPLPVVYCLLALLIFAGWRLSNRTAETAPCVANCNHAVNGAC